jgi:hypothetical protein
VASGVFVAVVVVGFAAEGFFGVVVDVGDFAVAAGFFVTGFTAGAWEDCTGIARAGSTLSTKVAASSIGPLAIASFRILSKQRLWFWRSLIMCKALCVMLQIHSTGGFPQPRIQDWTIRNKTGRRGAREDKGKLMDVQMRSVKIAFRFDEGRLPIRFARNY